MRFLQGTPQALQGEGQNKPKKVAITIKQPPIRTGDIEITDGLEMNVTEEDI